jgi:hypothetical protein
VHRVVIAILFFASFSFAQSADEPKMKVEDLTREAQVSNALSDRFRSLRLTAFLKDKRLDSFLKDGVVEYLESFQRLSSQSALSNECGRLSKVKDEISRDKVLYTCARLMFDDYALKRSQEFLEQVSTKSTWFVPAQILLSTIYLSNSDGEKCVQTLPPKMIKQVKNSQTSDLFHLTRARCFVEINQSDKAILEYQLINTTSPFYFFALVETVLTQFKQRHLESARTLLDVMITTYESGYGDERKGISTSMYFRSRYLQAYIELVLRNSKRSEALFKSLKEAIEKFEKQSLITESAAAELAKRISAHNLEWIDMRAIPKDIQGFLEMTKEWGDIRFRKRLDRLIDYKFALSRELKRLQDEPKSDFDEYVKNLRTLDQKTSAEMELEFMRAQRNIARSIRVMKIKSDLGRIEIIWADRAQGVRGIGELLESYQQEVDEVEDFFGQ